MTAAQIVACRVCQDAAPHPRHSAREMMFGTGESFEYFQCGACGCLQIAAVPADLARHYPPRYASMAADAGAPWRSAPRRLARRARDRHAVLGGGVLGALLLRLFPDPALSALRPLRLERSARILDVGSGVGLHLLALQQLGFGALLGIDPFLDQDRFHPPALHLRRLGVHDLGEAGGWDLVMYHHAFEHVPDPLEQLRAVRRLLAPGGRCLIRIPVADSEAWERYRTDWVQLDAPRHLFLHTARSMRVLAERAGMVVERVAHDSTAFQFWGSEQYRRGLPLAPGAEGREAWDRGLFSRAQMRAFAREAERLNALGRGDQAVFVLRPDAP